MLSSGSTWPLVQSTRVIRRRHAICSVTNSLWIYCLTILWSSATLNGVIVCIYSWAELGRDAVVVSHNAAMRGKHSVMWTCWPWWTQWPLPALAMTWPRPMQVNAGGPSLSGIVCSCSSLIYERTSASTGMAAVHAVIREYTYSRSVLWRILKYHKHFNSLNSVEFLSSSFHSSIRINCLQGY